MVCKCRRECDCSSGDANLDRATDRRKLAAVDDVATGLRIIVWIECGCKVAAGVACLSLGTWPWSWSSTGEGGEAHIDQDLDFDFFLACDPRRKTESAERIVDQSMSAEDIACDMAWKSQ